MLGTNEGIMELWSGNEAGITPRESGNEAGITRSWTGMGDTDGITGQSQDPRVGSWNKFGIQGRNQGMKLGSRDGIMGHNSCPAPIPVLFLGKAADPAGTPWGAPLPDSPWVL